MEPCPCGSGKTYAECCQPYLEGTSNAPTAEGLMRSRYTAYVKKNVDHLINSILPAKRKKHDARNMEAWSEAADWQGLEIVQTSKGGESDTEGMVEFIATYKVEDEVIEHHEIARFVKEDERWYFREGQIVGNEPIVNEKPKVKPNEPCPCGSGKKYKKCCARAGSAG